MPANNDPNPIPPVTRNDPAAHSGDVAGENIAALKALFPSIVTDGKVDFEVLRQLLGDEVEVGTERYGLNWKGKARARAFALTPSLGTLRPAKVDSKDWDTTKNILIEGDNLEVLKLLRKSYAGKVKLIYIDPPYNTGKDFVYPDNYTDSLTNYEKLTGQRGEDGARRTSNKETSGRFHTDWLNMMYPRLMLAKELLREDGVLFVSCDNAELQNLISLMDSIFGRERQAAIITWLTKRAARGVPPVNMLITNHEYLVGYDANDRSFCFLGDERDLDDFVQDGDPRGPWRSESMRATGQQDNWFEIRNPKTGHCYNGNWAFSQSAIEKMIADDKIIWPVARDGTPRQKKYFDSYINDRKAIVSYWDWHSTEVATSNLMTLFDDTKVFDFPKPGTLIQRLVHQASSHNDLILDFFAGSGTTGHAVMAQNAADGGNRRYILVQLPEPLDPAKAEQKTAADFCDKLGKPRTIAELTKERLRRAGAKVKADNPKADIDTGFRVYKLSSSNLKPWSPGDDLAADLLDAAGNILPGRSEEDLLVELLLKTGIDLTLPADAREIAGCTVHLLGGGTLIVCLSDIPADKARALGDGIADWLAEVTPPAPTTFFFKDSGFDAVAGGTIGPRSAEARANLAATLRQRLGKDAIEKLGAI